MTFLTKSAIVSSAIMGALIGIGGWYLNPTQENIRSCEHLVKSQLKSPATAVFSEEVFTPMGEGVGLDWDVDGEVDSQNSYGAIVRSHYACVMRAKEDVWSVQWDDKDSPHARESRRLNERLKKLIALKEEIQKDEALYKDLETGKVVLPPSEFMTPKMAKAIAVKQLDKKLHELGAK